MKEEDRAVSPTPRPARAWPPGAILFLLFLLNLLNFFDRTLPSVVNEPLRKEWGLSDLQLGLVGSAFTLVYAAAGVPLGRLSDSRPRGKILGACLLAWSVLTAATAAATGYASFFLVRLGIGVGEAGCAPAASSIIGDLYPSERRARAIGLFMLGLPLGLVAAFLGGGQIVRATGSWRAPFLVAAVPGILVALVVLLMPDPPRGGAETTAGVALAGSSERPIRSLLRIPTMLWIIASGITVNFSAYAGNGFMVSLLQRYFGMPIAEAANTSALMLGGSGLVGLSVGGLLADRIRRASARGRLLFGAGCLLAAAPATYTALTLPPGSSGAFTVLFGLGWLLYYAYYNTTYSALQDVVPPHLRATAMSLYFAGMYVLGGSLGPTVVGGLSDRLARAAMARAGAAAMTPALKAQGLHDAMILIPAALFLTGLTLLAASRTFTRDAARLSSPPGEG